MLGGAMPPHKNVGFWQIPGLTRGLLRGIDLSFGHYFLMHRFRWVYFGFGWSKLEGSGIPGVGVKSVYTRRKAECEGISLGLN